MSKYICHWCDTESEIKEAISIKRVCIEPYKMTVHLLGKCPNCGLEAFFTYHMDARTHVGLEE